MSKKSIICPKGHNKEIVGVSKSGRCKLCQSEYDKKNRIPHPRVLVQFCPKGHDTFICGRTKNRQCTECRKYVPRPKKQFCIHGHDIVIWGRDKCGRCKRCLKEKHPLAVGFPKTQFCSKGHDKDIVGKDKRGRCLKCREEYVKKWRETNKEHIREVIKKYTAKHRKEKQKWHKNKLLLDVNYKLRIRLRDRMIKAIKKQWKAGSAVRDVGCSIDFLKSYIEDKFYNDMTWDSWGPIWELDHIVPLWKFDLTNREQFLQAAHYTNLQPLIVVDHRIKSVKETIEREKIRLDK